MFGEEGAGGAGRRVAGELTKMVAAVQLPVREEGEGREGSMEGGREGKGEKGWGEGRKEGGREGGREGGKEEGREGG